MDRKSFDIFPGSYLDCDEFVAHGGEGWWCHFDRRHDFLGVRIEHIGATVDGTVVNKEVWKVIEVVVCWQWSTT